MRSKDGNSITRWQTVKNALSAFIQTRLLITDSNNNKDLASIIFHDNQARIICKQEQLQKISQKIEETPPRYGGNSFYLAISKIKEVIKDDLQAVVLFLSDGGDCDKFIKLEKELNELKSQYGKIICRWWNIGFGPAAEKSILIKMREIMKSETCDAQFRESVEAEQLIENFEDLANDEELNF